MPLHLVRQRGSIFSEQDCTDPSLAVQHRPAPVLDMDQVHGQVDAWEAGDSHFCLLPGVLPVARPDRRRGEPGLHAQAGEDMLQGGARVGGQQLVD